MDYSLNYVVNVVDALSRNFFFGILDLWGQLVSLFSDFNQVCLHVLLIQLEVLSLYSFSHE